MSNCAFSYDPNDLELTHAPITNHDCPPREVDIIGEDDDSVHKFYTDCLNNLEANATFYPSMRSQDFPIVAPPDHFAYLHPEVTIGPMVPPSSGHSFSQPTQSQPFYEHTVTNIPIKFEETYGKWFTILSKQGCDTKLHEHDIHQIFEQQLTEEKTTGLWYQDPYYLDIHALPPRILPNVGMVILNAPPNLNILLPWEKPLPPYNDKDFRIPMGPYPPSIHEQGEYSKEK